VLERGRRAYVLRRFEKEPPQSIFGCMRERTTAGVGPGVVGAAEHWLTGDLP
jgi:hypothetical protein